MKNTIRTITLLVSLVSSFAFGQAERSDSPPNREANEKAIKEALRDFADTWNRHDAKAFSMAFADDADFTNVIGMSAHGRAEIEKFHAPMFATRFKDTHLKITDVKIRFITPEVAAVDEWWEMTGAKGQDGREISLRKGLVNLVMTRSNGRWPITVMHNMDLPQQ
jgi:uncharacterized protein (TIGR02246 family)